MRRNSVVLVVLVVVLSLLPLAAVRAERPDRLPADLEAAVQQMEGLLADLTGIRDVKPVFKDHGGGLYSVSIELPENAAELIASSMAARKLSILAVGHQLTTPSSLSAMIHAALSNVGSDYNFWWAWLNTGNSTVFKKTTNIIKGPGRNYRRTDQVQYARMSVGASWFRLADAFTREGTFNRKTTIATGGNCKTKAFAM